MSTQNPPNVNVPVIKWNQGMRGNITDSLERQAGLKIYQTPRLTNVENFGAYKTQIALPAMPVCFPYNPVGNYNVRDANGNLTGAVEPNGRKYGGNPGINVAIKLDGIKKEQLPTGVMDQLRAKGVALENLEVNFCVQDTPWVGGPILFRPHPFLHKDKNVPEVSKTFDATSQPYVGLMDINSPLDPNALARVPDIRTHGTIKKVTMPDGRVVEEPGPVVCSIDQFPIQTVDPKTGQRTFAKNDTTHAFYSLCIDTDAVPPKAALTMHWLVSDKDHAAINTILREEDRSLTMNNRSTQESMQNFIQKVSTANTSLSNPKDGNLSPIAALNNLVNGTQPVLKEKPTGSGYVVGEQPVPRKKAEIAADANIHSAPTARSVTPAASIANINSRPPARSITPVQSNPNPAPESSATAAFAGPSAVPISRPAQAPAARQMPPPSSQPPSLPSPPPPSLESPPTAPSTALLAAQTQFHRATRVMPPNQGMATVTPVQITTAHAHQQKAALNPSNKTTLTSAPMPAVQPLRGGPAEHDLHLFFSDIKNQLKVLSNADLLAIPNGNKLTANIAGKPAVEMERDPKTGEKTVKILGDWKAQINAIEATVLACKSRQEDPIKINSTDPEFAKECLKQCIKHDFHYKLSPETEVAIQQKYGSIEKIMEGINNEITASRIQPPADKPNPGGPVG